MIQFLTLTIDVDGGMLALWDIIQLWFRDENDRCI